MRYLAVLRRGIIALLVLVAACSGQTPSTDQNGAAELTLVLSNSPEGVRSVEYVISCEGGFSFDGLMNVVPDRDPPIWEAIIGLPEGTCEIVLTALNQDGSPLCTGSTTIEVVAGTTVKADVELSCPSTGGPAVGNVDIDGTFTEIPVNVCPIIHHMGAIPSQLREGESTSEIQVRTSDPDMGPEPLSIELSAPRGQLTSPNSPDSMFVCPDGGGQVEVTAKVSDGFPQCDQEQSVTVFCPGQGDLCEGVDCSDDNECTADVCTEGVCSNPEMGDGVPCDGGNGSCQSGQCVPKADPCEGVDCSDGNDCTADFCVEGTCVNNTVDDGVPCQDGAGSCVAGECVIPTGCEGVDCNDDNDCTEDSCDAGTCSNSNVPDGQLCEGGAGTCQSGDCVITDLCEGVDCDDDNECTTDSCLAGVCSNVDVTDGSSCGGGTGTCQSGSCEPIDLCEGVSCGDGNECTADVCTDGTCSNPAVADGTSCDGGAGSCQSGQCVAVDPCEGVECSDGNDCTADFCSEGNCVNVNVDDGVPCQGGAGSCLSGECVLPSGCEGVDCDDGNDCTADSCALGLCGYEDLPDGQLCEGGAGTCQSGDCVITDLCEGVNCEDNNECTTDSCLAGVCSNVDVADGTSCGGGTGTCQSGSCEPIDLCAGVDCDDDNVCTDDSCADGLCINAPVADGTVCGIDSECQNGVCTFTGGGTPDPAVSAGPLFCGDVDAQENYQFPLTATFTPLGPFQVGVPTAVQYETVMDVTSSSIGSVIGTTLFFETGDVQNFEVTYVDYVWEVTGATTSAELAHSVPGTPLSIDPDANGDDLFDDIELSTGVSEVMLTPTGGPIRISLRDASLRVTGIQLFGGGFATWELSTIPENQGEDPSCDASLRSAAEFAAP